MNLDRVPITIGHSLFSGYSYTIEWSYSVFASRHLPWTSETKKGFKTPEDATHAAKERLIDLQKKVDKEEAKRQERRKTWSIDTWLDEEGWSFEAFGGGSIPSLIKSDDHYPSREQATEAAKKAIRTLMTEGDTRSTEQWIYEEEES